MEPVRLLKYQRGALKAILILQMIHTLLFQTVDMIMRLTWARQVFRFKQGFGLVAETVPWSERLPWDELAVWCLASIAEIILWRSLPKLKSHTWSFVAILLITTFLYVSWLGAVGDYSDLWGVLDICLLLAVPCGCAVLWRSRTLFTVRSTHFIQVGLALMIASSVVFVKGHYFPDGVIDWVKPVPVYVDIIAVSGFIGPQERALVLCWICYALIATLVYAFSRCRSKTAVKIPAL